MTRLLTSIRLSITGFIMVISVLRLSAQAPQIFGEGIISTGDYESHPGLSPGGDTLYFVKSAPDITHWTICVSYRKNGKWSNPIIAPFSGRFADADPIFSKDGNSLYFISNRNTKGDAAKTDMDIWKMTKTPKGWGEPMRLNENINSDKDEYYPTFTDDGTMYFGSERNGTSDIYRAPLVDDDFGMAQKLDDAINTEEFNEYEPLISPDESFMVFMATRPDGLANGDLYYSLNQNGVWTKATKLPEPFNTSSTEWSPRISADGKWFLFGSARSTSADRNKLESTEEMNRRNRSAGNGLSDIYQIEFSVLNNALNK